MFFDSDGHLLSLRSLENGGAGFRLPRTPVGFGPRGGFRPLVLPVGTDGVVHRKTVGKSIWPTPSPGCLLPYFCPAHLYLVSINYLPCEDGATPFRYSAIRMRATTCQPAPMRWPTAQESPLGTRLGTIAARLRRPWSVGYVRTRLAEEPL